jgi:transcriptional regulator with XRE-family HTH domain
MTAARPVGELLREWRERRRLSQLDLSIQAEVSTRHLSFVETGRSKPTPEMILRLTEELEVPLRERNLMLLAGGYAPAYPEHAFDEPQLGAVRAALRQVLTGHEPYPAVVVNRWWELLDANSGIALLTGSVAPALLRSPVNVLRLSLHPQGLAHRIVNLGQWRHHLFERLRQQIHATGDGALASLLEELRSYPEPEGAHEARLEGEMLGVLMPFRFRTSQGAVLNFISTTTIFGTPVDVTLQELALETFFPADEATAAALRQLAGATTGG